MSGLMPAYILREFANNGSLLSGGLMYFYESGTLVPKATYTDFTLTIPASNPVIFDASGAADIWLGEGAYRVLLKDANGVQIRPPIDGIVGSGSGSLAPITNASVAILDVYADVRAIASPVDVVYASGRLQEGDGGAGWFQYIPFSTETDDDGIILRAGSYVYKRVFSGDINPEWYGVVYGAAVDNTAAIANAFDGSIRFNVPVRFTGSTYLTQNTPVPAGTILHCTIDGYFNSGSAVTMAFATGAKFDSIGTAFGSTVNPTFGVGVAPALRLSWFGGAIDSDRWTKAAASTTNEYKLIVDIDTTTTGVTAPANFEVDVEGGARIIFSGTANLSLANVIYEGNSQFVVWPAIANVGTVVVGGKAVRPEWFGAVGDGSADDSLGFFAAAKSGTVNLTQGKNYLLGSTWSTTPTPLVIKNGVVTLGTGKTLGTGTLGLESTLIIKSDAGNWFAGTSLAAVSSGFKSTYTATTTNIVGCTLTGDNYFPMFAGKPKLYNGHLDVLNAQLLCTDTVGKIGDAKDILAHSAQLLGTDADGHIIDAGPSISLTKLGLAGLLFSDWNHAAITGTVTLSNPLRMFYIVDNTSGVDITLPTMSDTTQPNFVVFFNNVSSANVTIRGAFARPAGSSIVTGLPTLLYYDYYASKWNLLVSSA